MALPPLLFSRDRTYCHSNTTKNMAQAEKARGAEEASGSATSQQKNRIFTLSQPKISKATYWTTFEPTLRWGNQETIWPLSKAALKAKPTDRVVELAQSKKNHRDKQIYIPEFQYSCGRESGIWEISSVAARAACSDRIKFLARHKSAPPQYKPARPQHDYSCGRCSPLWDVSVAAMKCGDRPRTASLAVAKCLHPLYEPSGPIISVISDGVKTYHATPRIESLANPKKRLDGPFRDPIWVVSKETMQASPSPRVVELAKHKRLMEGYQPSRSPIWRVTSGAKKAVASKRMTELATPIVRETMDLVQFNPEAFFVSENAKKAKASGRVQELAQPIVRE